MRRGAQARPLLAQARAGAAAGMLGLAAVGLLEGLIVWGGQSVAGLGAIAYAIVSYGLCGAVTGAAAGVGVGWLTGRTTDHAAAIDAALWFFAGATVIGRFRLVRDVFGERVPAGMTPILLQIGALVGITVIAAGLFIGLHAAAARPAGRWLGRPLGAAGLLLALAGIAGGLAALPGRPGDRARAGGVAPPAGAPPIVLIVVDTLRADGLSSYGGTRTATPNIDALAAAGLRCPAAFAQASWTRPSIATIFTSLYPSSHGAVGKGDVLADSVTTVAEALRTHGYRTVGLANNANVTEAFNFQQGIDTYVYLAPDLFFFAPEAAAELTLYKQLRLVRERFLSRRRWVQYYYQPAVVVTDRALEVLDAIGDDPAFLFVHYMDPHDPYFGHPWNGYGVARVSTPSPEPARAAELARLYAGEIAYLDREVGRFLDGLRQRGLYDPALIVLTADHGEEFYEHGGWWHGTTLYDEQINVPLIMKPPAGRGRAGVPVGLVRHLDIAPTLLAVAGVPIPEEMQGRVLELAAPDGDGAAAVFSEQDFEGNVIRSVRTAQWKLIEANEGNPRGLPPEQLFRVAEDPGEQRSLYETQRNEAARLAASMDDLAREAAKYARAAEQRGIDGAMEQRLKALGYVD